MSFYLDASFMVALQLREAKTEVADQFLLSVGEPLLISEFGAGEFSAAVARLVRMGKITKDQAQEVFFTFDEWRHGAAELAEIEQCDLLQTKLLVRRLESSLPMPDALHIAIAMRRGAVLVTFDEGMARAARMLDVDVIIPG